MHKVNYQKTPPFQTTTQQHVNQIFFKKNPPAGLEIQTSRKGVLPQALTLTKSEQYLLKLAKKKILKLGNKIFDKDPELCEKIVNLGYKAAQMLLNLLSITDKKLELHIPSTAVGLARKIVQKGDSDSINFIRFFTKAFKEKPLVSTHIFHILKDCRHPDVFNTMSALFQFYSAIDDSKMTFESLSYLRFSTIYLAQNGTVDHAINLSKLLDSSSNQIRIIGGTNLINFTLREDITNEDKLKLGEFLLSSISKNSNFFSSKLEVLEKGNFEEVLDKLFSNIALFNTVRLGKTMYYSIFERFLSVSSYLQTKFLDSLDSSSVNPPFHLEFFKFSLNTLFNNLRKKVLFPSEFYKKCFAILSKISFEDSFPLDLRKKIALIFSFFPSFIIKPWKEEIYLRSINDPKNEFYIYVYQLAERLEEEKESQSKVQILLVSADDTFSSIFSSRISYYLSKKGLKNVEILNVDSSIEAIFALRNQQNIKICFLTEKIINPSQPRKPFLNVLEDLNKFLKPPKIIFFYTPERQNYIEVIKKTFSSLNVKFYPKHQALAEAENILKSLTISREIKEDQVSVSASIFDHLNDPKIINIIKKHYGDFVQPSKSEPFGKNVLILERGNQAHIQLKEETTNPRIRFLFLLGSTQSALLDRSGLKKAEVEHLGGFNLGASNISSASNSVMVYYDIGGKKPTGRLQPMKWKKDNEEFSALSKGDKVQFIYSNRKGTFSCFVNTSGRPVLLKLIEYV